MEKTVNIKAFINSSNEFGFKIDYSKTCIFILAFLFKVSLIFSQTTDIRPNAVNYPVLSTASILALTPTVDGLRQGTTVYNSDLKTLVIYDGCEWSVIDNNYITDQNTHQELVAPSPQNGANFGFSMEISDKILVVGANLMDVGGNVDQGEVYVYWKNGCFWQYFATLGNPGGAAGDNFGTSVDIQKNPFVATQFLIAVSGLQKARTYKLTVDAGGNPISIMADQLIVNTHTTPFKYIKIGNQMNDDEINITHGTPNFFKFTDPNSFSTCNSSSSSNNKVVIYRRVSGAYSIYYSSPISNIFSPAVTIQSPLLGRFIFYGNTSCLYWGSSPGTFNKIEKLEYTGAVYLPNLGVPIPNSAVLPFIDLDNSKRRYSQIAIGDQLGRNRSIKILTLTVTGRIEKEENIIESNVYECIGLPGTCLNGVGGILNADFYGSKLSISGDKLIVGSPYSDYSFAGPFDGTGKIYLYKKRGVWALEKILSGNPGQGIGNWVVSTEKNYAYSQTTFNTNQGKVYIGEW